MKNERNESIMKKDKLTLISKIDELKIIANNHLLMKRYSEAIKAAEKIINLALEAKMSSIIKEQEEFITNIYKIVETDKLTLIILDDFNTIKSKYGELSKKNKFQEAHNLIQTFKEKYNEYYDLSLINEIQQFLQEETKRWDCYREEEGTIRLLEPLEIQFNSYIYTNNIPLARDTLVKAKSLLEKISLEYVIDKWKRFESEYRDYNEDYQLKGDFDKKIEIIATLTDEYKFEEAYSLLSTLIKIAEDKSFKEYKDKLATKKRNIEDAERKYRQLLNDIASLDVKMLREIENDQYSSAIDNSDQIIKIARFIDNKELLNKYEKKKEILKERMIEHQRFSSLKEKVIEESEMAISKINQEQFVEALKKYRAILDQIRAYYEK